MSIESNNSPQLVRGPRLLEILFDEPQRPCIRWLRAHQSEWPHIKIGRSIFFDPKEVREALEKKKIVDKTQPVE